ncbi:MAG: 16S rRNA (guanine(527)-N(7))-methyltransferase RsmG [Nitrospinales bacterium]
MKKQIVEALRSVNAGPLAMADPERAAERALFFIRELMRWNRQINLTAEMDEKSIFERHFIDSLQFARAMTEPGETIDIGSGAGFPGIPLKIVFPEMKITLLESRRKRASFLGSVLRNLGLKHIDVLQYRAEQLARSSAYQGHFQYALLRAVAKLDSSLALGAPLIHDGGKLIIKKGVREKTEADAVCQNLALARVGEIPLTNRPGAQSRLVIFQKCST